MQTSKNSKNSNKIFFKNTTKQTHANTKKCQLNVFILLSNAINLLCNIIKKRIYNAFGCKNEMSDAFEMTCCSLHSLLINCAFVYQSIYPLTMISFIYLLFHLSNCSFIYLLVHFVVSTFKRLLVSTPRLLYFINIQLNRYLQLFINKYLSNFSYIFFIKLVPILHLFTNFLYNPPTNTLYF